MTVELTIELTVESLRLAINRAARCERVSLPADDFRAIHDFATRLDVYDNMNLGHLDSEVKSKLVQLTGRELRILLMLAFEAIRADLPPRTSYNRKK